MTSRRSLQIVSSVLAITCNFIGVSGCSRPTNDQSSSQAIIGEDQRQSLGSSDFSATIGTLLTPMGPCTAFLTGPQEVTTAAHCVQNSKGDFSGYFFGLSNDINDYQIRSVLQTTGDKVRLSLGASFPQYLVQAPLQDHKSLAIISVKHDEGELITDPNCQVTKNSKTGDFRHDCDTTPGASGSPIFQGDRVVGVHAGYLKGEHINVATTALPTATEKGKFKANAWTEFQPEVSCDTNCYRHCRRKVLGNWISNPVCEAACQAERLLQCNPPSPEVKVCGTGFLVSAALYGACSLATATIPPACTAGAAVTAGSACAVSVGTAAGICGVSVSTIKVAAVACIAAAAGVGPESIKLEW